MRFFRKQIGEGRKLLSQLYFRSAAIAASLMVGISAADAAAPVEIDGWRYIEGPNDLHIYVCGHPDCVEGSRVICHFDAPKSAVFPGIWRKYEGTVSALLGEQGKTFSPFAMDLSSRRASSIATSSDGAKNYYVLGDVSTLKWRASLSSASGDEKASQSRSATLVADGGENGRGGWWQCQLP